MAAWQQIRPWAIHEIFVMGGSSRYFGRRSRDGS
jgi:hypothetical protein